MLRAFEVFFGGAFMVLLVYVILKDGGTGANNVLQGLGTFNAKTFGALSGQAVA